MQYWTGRLNNGSGWWALGSAAMSLGFAFNFFRDHPVLGMAAVIANNLLFIVSAALYLVGAFRFLGRKLRVIPLAAFCALAFAAILFFTFAMDKLSARRFVSSASIAALSLLTAWPLAGRRHRGPTGSQTILAAAFSMNAVFFCYRSIAAIFESGTAGAFLPTPSQVSMYLLVLVTGTAETLMFILMVNQRLVAQGREDKENLQTIFTTNPDASLITRLEDGTCVDVNEKFLQITGYARSELIGRTTLELNIWGDGAQRDLFVSSLENKGFCDELELMLMKKDGSLITGLVSARVIIFQGKRHILSVTRDITERKRGEERVQELVRQLEVEKEYAQIRANTDGLTMLANRRHFDEALNAEFLRLRRSGGPLSLVMLDIDYFKKFNDRYGHLAGDDCLRRVASALAGTIGRSPDFVARYGGEEFIIILPETESPGALVIAERVRMAVEDQRIPHESSDAGSWVTVSLGVATVWPSRLPAPVEAIEYADSALYEAKKNGRNRVSEYRPGMGIDLAHPRDAHVKLIWHRGDECGNETIDSQHRALFSTANDLLAAVMGGNSKAECVLKINALLDGIVAHFRDEELIFSGAKYPQAEEHMRIHADLVSKAAAVAGKYGRDELSLGELFNFLAYDVVAQHMLLEDRKFFPYIGQE